MPENLYEKIESLWSRNERAIDHRLNKWLNALSAGEERILKSRRQFHTYGPLEPYVSVTRLAAAKDVAFSLRFYGVRVADVVVADVGSVGLLIDKQSWAYGRKGKRRVFKMPLSPKPEPYPWADNDREVQQFKTSFKKEKASISHWMECRVMSYMTSLMAGREGNKPKRLLRGYSPVLMGGCPLQVPVPFNANTGEPRWSGKGNGWLDILAYAGHGRNAHLAVWELKQPDKLDRAVRQVYIYAATLLKVLRSPTCGRHWYRLFFPNQRMRSRLTIDAIVAVTPRMHESVRQQFARSRTEMPLTVGPHHDVIRPFVAYYDVEPEFSISKPAPLWMTMPPLNPGTGIQTT